MLLKKHYIFIYIFALITLYNCNGTFNMTHKNDIPSIKKLGLSTENNLAVFRVFSAHATHIKIAFFDDNLETPSEIDIMKKDENSIWEYKVPLQNIKWSYYAYIIDGPDSAEHEFDATKYIADPYSRGVVRKNNYLHPSRTIIDLENKFDWENDNFTHLKIEDAIILEAHLKDMTVHPSADNRLGGSYLGFVENEQNGGVQHLKDLGINAVEFLPLQDFGNIEIDYKNPELPVYNTWNAYEKNHWGYMTTFFFAPEVNFSSEGNEIPNEWIGKKGKAVNEMKSMVKALHAQGISVIMDVVYNHVSQYDENPYKFIDKASYFKLNEDGTYCGASGCGNDFDTAAPMSRRMIVESIEYWMKEFHIDGFRFDLAAMIDSVTVDEITRIAKSINPDVMLIGEPWGGGAYNPRQLADQNWASWNDQFRNSVKGRWPENGDYGFIFGKYWDNRDESWYHTLFKGFTQKENGHYKDASQSVNYLESHDDHTLGDFIRIASGKIGLHDKTTASEMAELSDKELKIHTLAALSLMTAQGPVMMAEGQSWGRSKVIAQTTVEEEHVGELDHNSYNKDNETNWLNWEDKSKNSALVDSYRKLIEIRRQSKALRNPDFKARTFLEASNDIALGFTAEKDDETVMVLINPSQKDEAVFNVNEGDWVLLFSTQKLDAWHKEKVSLPPQSGGIWIYVNQGKKDKVLLK